MLLLDSVRTAALAHLVFQTPERFDQMPHVRGPSFNLRGVGSICHPTTSLSVLAEAK